MNLLHFLSVSLLIATLLIILERDLTQRRIFLLPVFVLGLVGALHAYLFRQEDLRSLFIGGAIGGVFFGAQYFLSKKHLIGLGDVWLGIALGFVFGWMILLFVLLLAYVGGTIISLALLAIGRVQRRDPLPLGSFLAVASICVLLTPVSWIVLPSF